MKYFFPTGNGNLAIVAKFGDDAPALLPDKADLAEYAQLGLFDARHNAPDNLVVFGTHKGDFKDSTDTDPPYALAWIVRKGASVPIGQIGHRRFVTENDALAVFDQGQSPYAEHLYSTRRKKAAAQYRTFLELSTQKTKMTIWQVAWIGSWNKIAEAVVYEFAKPEHAEVCGPNKTYRVGFDPAVAVRCLGVVGNVKADLTTLYEPIYAPAIDCVSGQTEAAQDKRSEYDYVMKTANQGATGNRTKMRNAAYDAFYNWAAWQWAPGPTAYAECLKAWNAEIANPSRCSLIDGAEMPETNGTTIKMAFDVDEEATEMSCVITARSADGFPSEVEITGLTYCPMSVYGQLVINEPDANRHNPKWKPGYEGITRILSLAAATTAEAAYTTNAQPSDPVKNPPFWMVPAANKSDPPLKSQCPRMYPNFLTVDGVPGGSNNITPASSTQTMDPILTPSDPNASFPAANTIPVRATKTTKQMYDYYYKKWVKPRLAQLKAQRNPDVVAYLHMHSLDRWQSDIDNKTAITLDPALKKEYYKRDIAIMKEETAYLWEYYANDWAGYLWFVAGWPYEFGPLPKKPSTLHDQHIHTNACWDVIAAGYNPAALMAIAAAELPICLYIYVDNQPLWYAPLSLIGMVGAYAGYVSYTYDWDTFKESLVNDWHGVKKGVKEARAAGKTAEDVAPYVIAGGAGLGLTLLVMAETYNEIGAAGAEVIGIEFIVGASITTLAEIIIYFHKNPAMSILPKWL